MAIYKCLLCYIQCLTYIQARVIIGQVFPLPSKARLMVVLYAPEDHQRTVKTAWATSEGMVYNHCVVCSDTLHVLTACSLTATNTGVL